MVPNRFRRSVLVAWFSVMSLATAACGANGVEGTYSNGGSVVLDLRSGGKADLTLMGELEHCSWKATDSKVTLSCKEGSVDFTRHDDGSLSGPVYIGQLKKSKN